MKKRELLEYRKNSLDELNIKLGELRKKKVDAMVKKFSGKEKNLKTGKKIRRDIAQLLSIIREKEVNKIKETKE